MHDEMECPVRNCHARIRVQLGWNGRRKLQGHLYCTHGMDVLKAIETVERLEDEAMAHVAA